LTVVTCQAAALLQESLSGIATAAELDHQAKETLTAHTEPGALFLAEACLPMRVFGSPGVQLLSRYVKRPRLKRDDRPCGSNGVLPQSIQELLELGHSKTAPATGGADARDLAGIRPATQGGKMDTEVLSGVGEIEPGTACDFGRAHQVIPMQV
jgi:hypothetical protein